MSRRPRRHDPFANGDAPVITCPLIKFPFARMSEAGSVYMKRSGIVSLWANVIRAQSSDSVDPSGLPLFHGGFMHRRHDRPLLLFDKLARFAADISALVGSKGSTRVKTSVNEGPHFRARACTQVGLAGPTTARHHCGSV